jgi:AsmA protein
MQETAPIHEHAPGESAPPRHNRRGIVAFLAFLLVLLLLVFIPPYITVNRFQRRIAANISASLGRPVHFDSATLNLLPLPGFTLERFVVDEDPAFGFEPILRADEVRANLRLRSLWNHRIELSRISLTEPSVNLVRTANGQWNLQSILIHTSSIQAAPTGQRYAGPAPRFPYIEATGARINLKLDQEKTPFSLTDADFSLSLPEPRQWRFRLEAHPTRSDTTPADAGTLSLEGTLGSAATPADAPAKAIADIPIGIQGNWRGAQLGGLSRLLLGRDAGLRGELALTLNIAGTISRSLIATNIKIAGGRRADFVPPRPLALEAACQAIAGDTFHTFSAIECHWPPADSSDPSILILAAAIPDTRRPSLSSADLTIPALPSAILLDWLRIATPHPPTGLLGTGTLAGTLAWRPNPIFSPNSDFLKTVISTEAPEPAAGDSKGAQRKNPQLSSHDAPTPTWSGELELSGESIQLPSPNSNASPIPISLGDILLRSTPPPTGSHPATAPPAATGFDLLPILLPLGGRQPATLEGHFDAHGYILHLTGSAIPARLLALGDAIPQLGDGLRQLLKPTVVPKPTTAGSATPHSAATPPSQSEPIHLDLTATRLWGGPQTWTLTTPSPPHSHRRPASPSF